MDEVPLDSASPGRAEAMGQHRVAGSDGTGSLGAGVRAGRSGVHAAGGTMFCLCSYFWAGRTNREVVFCSLIAAHKQSAEFSRCCSTVTASEVTAQGGTERGASLSVRMSAGKR